jgi:hypothetical protein
MKTAVRDPRTLSALRFLQNPCETSNSKFKQNGLEFGIAAVKPFRNPVRYLTAQP